MEIMADAEVESYSYLKDKRDDLRDKLVVLQGHLKHTFDYTDIINPLLDYTAPATNKANQR
jgi:hypothetical protein